MAWIQLLVLALTPQAPAVEREWEVREWALDPARHRAELTEALSSDEWTRRADALDALLRARDVVGVEPSAEDLMTRAARCALDEHPNVRALGLRLAGRLPAQGVEELAASLHPEVREACAALLRHGREPADLERLHALAFDDEPYVRAAARASLFLHDEPALVADVLARTLTRIDAEEGLGGVADGLLRWGRTGRVDAVHWDHAPGGDAARLAVREAFHAMRTGRADLDLLVEGWVAEAASDRSVESWEDLHPARRDLQLAGARAAGPAGDDTCAFFRAARALDEAGEAEAAYGYMLGWLAREEPQVAARLALGLSTDLQHLVWERIGGELSDGPAELIAPWLAPERDRWVRGGVLEVLADLYRVDPRPQVGAAIAGLLEDEDEDLARRAFEVLANAEDARPYLDALYASWRERPRDERLATLEDLPRNVVPTPFRGDLLALGANGARTSSVVELLGLFRGDAGVAVHLERWLKENVARLSGEVPVADRRRLELQTRDLAQALYDVTGEGCADALIEALARVSDTSEEVPKHLLYLLGTLPEARSVLLPWMASERSRLAVEAGIGLLPHEPDVARRVLAERYATCDATLRGRILRRVAEVGRALPEEEPLRAFLFDVVTRPSARVEERSLALQGLATCRDVPRLAAVLASATDIELRVTAVDALGEVGTEEAARALLDVHAAEAPAQDAPAEPEKLVDWLPLRDALLPAIVRCGAPREFVQEELLRAPVRRSAEDLERRFRGEKGPATGFVYRAELAAARVLAERGRLAELLEGGEVPWSRLDGRLLLQLGEAAAAEGGDPRLARRLLVAALVAFAGEPPAEDVPALAVHAAVRIAGIDFEARDYRRAHARLARVVDRYLTGAVPERSWRRVLGEREPALGLDPEARLFSATYQAAAWCALEDGDLERAAAWSRRARRALGASEEARREQNRFEEALRAARADAR